MQAVDNGSSERGFWVANAAVSALAVALLGWILVLRPGTGDPAALSFMPAVNAALNAVAASLMSAAFLAIRRKKRELHRALMLAALASSALFLAGYLAYHWVHGDTAFPAELSWRPVYLAVLASHVLLSIVALPMVLGTFWLALRDRVAQHRRLARWTLPIWLYVSVTGVAVFVMLRVAIG